MIFFIIGLIVLNLILLGVVIRLNKNLGSQQDKYKKEYISRRQNDLERQLSALSDELSRRHQEFARLESTVAAQRSTLSTLRATQQELIQSKENLIEKEVQSYRARRDYEINQELDSARANVEKQKSVLQTELINLKGEVNDWQKRRDAVNEEILRQRAMNEQQDFYRIVLSKETFEDIELFNSIRARLHNRTLLDKMIYDNYISKPTREMTKRILSGKAPSGIYKITNIQTKECYIGKSTDVSTRWVNHIKSACGLEGVADSQFQRALKKYGIDQFTFELLEEVPKDKLTEREKYYISLFDTTKFGYNQRIG